MHTAPYLTIFGLLAVFHAARIVQMRKRLKISMGDGGNLELQRLIRVFGNFSEFAPLGLILLIACELVQAPVWYLHLVGGSLLLGRCLHFVGLGKGHAPPRVFGMALTFLSLTLGSIGVLVFSVYVPS